VIGVHTLHAHPFEGSWYRCGTGLRSAGNALYPVHTLHRADGQDGVFAEGPRDAINHVTMFTYVSLDCRVYMYLFCS